jgi:hypothetical protein
VNDRDVSADDQFRMKHQCTASFQCNGSMEQNAREETILAFFKTMPTGAARRGCYDLCRLSSPNKLKSFLPGGWEGKAMANIQRGIFEFQQA